MDEFDATIATASFENVYSPTDICINIAVRSHVGIGDTNQRRKVKNDFISINQISNQMRVANIASLDVDLWF